MAQYTVQDETTGKKITFEWAEPQPPTETDMEEVFATAGGPAPLTAQEAAFDFEPQQPEEPGFLSKFPIGATVGGTLAGVVGKGKPSAIALGAAGGEAAEQLVRRATGLPAPETPVAAATGIGKEAGLAFVGERFVGPAISYVGKRALGHFSRHVSPAAREAIDFLESKMPSQQRGKLNPLRYIYGANKKKLAVLPAEATDDRLLDLVHNISEASIIGGGAVDKFKHKRLEFMSELTDDIISEFGEVLDADDLGKFFVDTIDERLSPARVATSKIYNTVDDMTRGASIVSTKDLKNFATPHAKVAKTLGGIEGKNAGDDLITSILDLPDTVDYTVMKELRTRLRSRVDEFSITNKKAPAIGKAKQLGRLADKAIGDALAEHNPDALSLWRHGNNLYAADSKTYNNAFIRKLIKTASAEFDNNPEAIVKHIFRGQPISRVRNVKNALGGVDASAYKRLQAWNTQDIFAKATDKTTGELKGARLYETMFGRTGLGEAAIREIYTPAQIKELKGFANALKVIQAKQAEGTGKMFIQLSQAGAILSLPTQAGGAARKAAATILIAPAILARAMTNPSVAKLLTDGVKGGPASKATAGLTGRFLTDIINMQYEDAASRRSEATEAEQINRLQAPPRRGNTPAAMGFTPRNIGAIKQ